MGELIGIATSQKNGLLSKDGLVDRGLLDSVDLENIKYGFTYAYKSDGSGFAGPILAFESFNGKVQIKFGIEPPYEIGIRTLNKVGSSVWSDWRLIK